MKRYKIVNPKRFYIFLSLLLVSLLFLTFSLSAFFIDHPVFGQAEIEGKTIIVKQGDTLWSLASPIAKKENKDIRVLLYEIQERNDLHSIHIFPGQELILPE